MVKEILTDAGLLHRQARFVRMPEGTHAVYFDDIDVEGADRVTPPTSGRLPRIYHHSVRIELYEPSPDDKAEASLEAQLDARGLLWTKEDRYWLEDAKRYQVLYSFDYTTK